MSEGSEKCSFQPQPDKYNTPGMLGWPAIQLERWDR